MRGGYRYDLTVLLPLVLLITQTTEEAIRCCTLANGSCRSACEQISLVSIATNQEELQNRLQTLNELCQPFMLSFWGCLNDTLNEIEKGVGWFGRPCCHRPHSERCRMACLQAQSILDVSEFCRRSDEVEFFNCIEKQEEGERCCKNAQTSSCSRACKDVFLSSFTPSKQIRDSVNKYCSQDNPKIQQCVHNYIQITPAEHLHKFFPCCDKSSKPQCRSTCKQILRTELMEHELIDKLVDGGCGAVTPQIGFWQCFLMNTALNVEPGGSLTESEKVGMDSAKLQCCFRAATVNCQRLCIETYSNQWTSSWYDFDRLCQYQLAESEMLQCLIEVDEPCELGCEGLTYCTNFNYRPTELFRNCNDQADNAAHHDVKVWEKGLIDLPMMTIPVLEISECHPNIWKAIACALQIKPCHNEAHVNMICKSECIDILNKCVDKRRLLPGQNPITLCEILSPPENSTPCISLSPYLAESKHIDIALEVTHPCKPNHCSNSEVCMVNRNCLFGQPCMPHVCVPGCKMGDMSQLIVPKNSHVRVPSNTHGPRCHMVCYCNQKGILEDCMTQPCLNNEICKSEGKSYSHNTKFMLKCKTCYCYAGEITCSQKPCGSGLPCNCPDHYVPVCGANGKTYPSVCLARCAGLTDDQFEFGACYDSDPCSPNSCHPYDKCVPRKRVCLSIKHRSCKQYDCVNTQHYCHQQPTAPVCDTDNVEHPNICWMLRRRKTLAHYGRCMPHCRGNGPVCGHNGETYKSECAAWAERVSVDYKGTCVAVGASYGKSSRCHGIKCPPFPSEHCTKVFPPGSCCPICGAAIRLLYSQKLADWSVEGVRDVNPVVIQTIAEKIREHVKVTECEVFAYLSLESDIVVIFVAITDSPTHLQVEACIREAEKINALIQQHSPNLLTELPLSFITTSTMIDPETDSACSSSSSISLIILLLVLTALIQRTINS